MFPMILRKPRRALTDRFLTLALGWGPLIARRRHTGLRLVGATIDGNLEIDHTAGTADRSSPASTRSAAPRSRATSWCTMEVPALSGTSAAAPGA